jgi:ABC-type sulfate transport system permease component
MSGKRRSFKVLMFTAIVFLTFFSLYLFLSNIDQLFVTNTPDTSQEIFKQWDSGHRNAIGHEFAGGFWKDPHFWKSLNLTLVVTAITTLLAALLGIPTAYALSRYKIPFKPFIEVLFSSLIVLPASSVGLCLIVMFNYGPLWQLQQLLHFRITQSIFPGMVIASFVLSFAFGVSAWKAAFSSINPRFEMVARTLGSSQWRVFRTICLPLAKNGLAAGIILAWTRAMAEFGAVLLFCGTFQELPPERFSQILKILRMDQADWLSISVWSHIEYGNVAYGFAIAFVLVIIGWISVYLMHRIGAKGYVW